MIDSATPAPSWARPAASDRHPLNRPVAPPLCRSRGHRPASTVRGHAGTRAMKSTICRSRISQGCRSTLAAMSAAAVLLVDDDAPIRRMLARTLTAEGYAVFMYAGA